MEQKKNNSILTKILIGIIIILLFLIVVGFIALLNKEDNNNQNNTEKVQNEKIDTSTKDELIEKIKYFHKMGYNSLNVISDKKSIYEEGISINELSEQAKIYYFLGTNFKTSTKEITCKEFYEQFGSNFIEGNEIISGNSYCHLTTDLWKFYEYDDDSTNLYDFDEVYKYVNARYKWMYGTDIKDFSLFNIDGCPSYRYYSKENVLMVRWACGGTGYLENESYIYKIDQDQKNFYVYEAQSFATQKDDNTISVYKDFENKHLYKNVPIEEYNNNSINKDNYKEFTKYKYTFTKDNLIFNSIERLK